MSVLFRPILSALVVKIRDMMISPAAINDCKNPIYFYMMPFYLRAPKKTMDMAPKLNILNILVRNRMNTSKLHILPISIKFYFYKLN